jgi:hypothetical protein
MVHVAAITLPISGISRADESGVNMRRSWMLSGRSGLAPTAATPGIVRAASAACR